MADYNEQIIIAGFGGQGVMLIGKLLAQTAMTAQKEITYLPSYGAEVRGGTANCMVIISDNPIPCPIIPNPDTVMAMNKASFEKFSKKLKPDGLLLYNSSLIDPADQTLPTGTKLLAVPADEIALKIGSKKAANMVMLGAYLHICKILTPQKAADSLKAVLAPRHHNMLPLNTEAILKGADFLEKNSS